MNNKNKIIKCLENILNNSDEARKWYLKTDLKIRLKLLVEEDSSVQDFISLWKRKHIIFKEFENSQNIINEAVDELAEELKNNKKWAEDAENRLNGLMGKLNDNSIRML